MTPAHPRLESLAGTAPPAPFCNRSCRHAAVAALGGAEPVGIAACQAMAKATPPVRPAIRPCPLPSRLLPWRETPHGFGVRPKPLAGAAGP